MRNSEGADMIRYLIKNNFKLMFRNTWSMVVMLIGPVLVIAVLSSAFSQMMKSYEGVDEFSVGYRMQEDAMEDNVIFESVKHAGKEAGIFFYEYPEGEVKDTMEKNGLAGFVEFTEDTYVVYKSADYEVEGITLEYFMNKVMNESMDAFLQIKGQENITLPVEELEFMPAVNARDYYGIVYIVYFCWCGMICATGVLSNEKKYGILRRFQVSNISETQNYFGKLIPITLTVAVGMAIATGITILLYDIHWGNPMLSLFIVFMMILAGAAFGMMIYNISGNMIITIIMVFTIVWFMGFFGGSFETYMFSSIPDTLKQLSPIYHGNRALVELSCMGESDYVASVVGYSLAITIICSMIAVLAGTIRKRGRV
ncbi:MAG: ABC transporter permease [Lachnospiraceae bacterium]|nr:ABC transporter permease [Lachnospiraceae bacterium]